MSSEAPNIMIPLAVDIGGVVALCVLCGLTITFRRWLRERSYQRGLEIARRLELETLRKVEAKQLAELEQGGGKLWTPDPRRVSGARTL